jgi:hypothetical protein
LRFVFGGGSVRLRGESRADFTSSRRKKINEVVGDPPALSALPGGM